MNARTYKCRGIVPGKVEGKAIISKDAISFYLCDPESGKIIEKNHSIEGRSIAKKILVMEAGKPSTGLQVHAFYELSKNGNLPLAIIVKEIEPVLVSAAVIFKTPLIDRIEENLFEIIKDGDWVEVDTEKGIITVKEN